VGIGLFIALIGCQNAFWVIDNKFVLVDFVDWTRLWKVEAIVCDSSQVPECQLPGYHAHAKAAIVCLVSLLAIAILTHYNIQGGVILAILLGTIIGIPLEVADTDVIAGKAKVSWKFWDNFRNYFRWNSERGGVFFGCFRGFNFPSGSAVSVVLNVISLGMVDLFDTMGTVVGCSTKAGLNEEDGKPGEYGMTMYSDSIASLSASMLGTSSVTTYVESGTGIAAGGRTGLVALTVSVLFFIAIFLLPVFAFIPTAAAGSALIYVGVLMLTTVTNVDFTDVTNTIPSFLTISMMPFTYSITKGIGLGMLSYILIHCIIWLIDVIIWAVKRGSNPDLRFPQWTISVVTLIVGLLFLVYFFVPMS
jgi:AGZA family xanthine/uracil permease-like MFS transporter